MPKIAVLVPDFFWSSVPYNELSLYLYLSQHFDADLLMFKDDIRLTKEFNGTEKFKFDPKHFKVKNLRKLEKWADLFAISGEYKLIISSAHLSPKNRKPEFEIENLEFADAVNHRFMTIDIGGSDIFANLHRAEYFCVKGPIWKEWLVQTGIDPKRVFVTGTTQYDPFFTDVFPNEVLSERKFRKKYGLSNKPLVLIAPTNPASHTDQFKTNLKQMDKLRRLAANLGHQVIIKTYPHDYVYYEKGGPFTGVYHRNFDNTYPQYHILERELHGSTVIESQDHFSALKYSEKLFNMSGSHIAWETCFTKCQSYSMNYENQPYYKSASYLPPFVEFPDDLVNFNMTKLEQMFDPKHKTSKKCSKYFCNEPSMPKIKKAIESILCAH